MESVKKILQGAVELAFESAGYEKLPYTTEKDFLNRKSISYLDKTLCSLRNVLMHKIYALDS